MSIKIYKSLQDTSRSSPSYGYLWNQSHSLLFTWHKILFILNQQLIGAKCIDIFVWRARAYFAFGCYVY